MRKLAYSLGAILIAIGLTGCGQPTPQELATMKKECQSKNNFSFTQGECLETYKVIGTKKGIVNIILHGVPGNNGRANVLDMNAGIAQILNEETAYTTYYYARPGYARSTSNNWYLDKKTSQEVNTDYVKFNKLFIDKLLKENQAKRINIFAFSGGTTLAANMIALYPGLVNKAVLVSGAYDVDGQTLNVMSQMGKSQYFQSRGGMQPINNVDKLDKNTKFLIISGDKDQICPAKFSDEFVKKLNQNNVNNKYVKIKQEDGLNFKTSHKTMNVDSKVLSESANFLK